MQIYILRHGIAEDAPAGQPDSKRALTDKGKSKLIKTLVRAREAGVAPGIILTSPYVRARQTAVIAKEVLKVDGELIETKALVPASSTAKAWEEVRAVAHDVEQIMLVGHNPLLGDLLCALIGAPAYGVDLKKGALALVEVEGLSASPRGTLIWLLTAKTAGE
jgi:phosphohistidine phosphatase